MTDPALFQRAELESDLKQLKSFAQSAPPAAEHTGSAMLRFSVAAARFVEQFASNPDTSPRELLLAAGEANARLEDLHREFDLALDHLERLPFKLDLDAMKAPERQPEDPRPVGA